MALDKWSRKMEEFWFRNILLIFYYIIAALGAITYQYLVELLSHNTYIIEHAWFILNLQLLTKTHSMLLVLTL